MRSMPVSAVVALAFFLAAGEARPGDTDAALAVKGSEQDMVLYQKRHGPTRGYHDLLVKTPSFGDFVFEADLCSSPTVSHFGLVFRYKDPENLYRLVLRPQIKDFRVEKVIRGKSDYASTKYVPFPFAGERWYHVRLAARDQHVDVQIDGKRVYGSDGFTELEDGRAGVTVVDPAVVEFNDIRINDADDKTVLFLDDFNSGLGDRWIVAGPEDVRGEWDVRPKRDSVSMRNDFKVDYGFQVGPAEGKNQSMFEFPGITKLRDGQLLTLFIEENQHGTPPWAAMPTCGKLWMARSTDLGRTWSQPTLFLDTPIDDRHAYAFQLANGELLAFFWLQPVALGINGIVNYATVSHDGGRTWADPWRFRTGRHQGAPSVEPMVVGGGSLTCPPIQLPDGTLAMAVATILPGNKPPFEDGILRSRDNGRTWGDYTTVASDPERSICFVEPVLVRLASGKWIVVTRTEVPLTPGTTHPYRLGPTMICTSMDEGRTWSKPAILPLEFTRSGSTNPFILQTKTGVVVFAVNTGTAFSYDDGRTWIPQDINFGYYPNLVEIEPGTLASLCCYMSGKAVSLTKPQLGVAPPPGPATPLQHDAPPPAATIAPATGPAAELQETVGMFRAIRVRQARDLHLSPLLAQPSQPVLAVARAMTDSGPVIAVAHRSPEGTWLPPLIAAASPAICGDPVLAQARNGTLFCAFPTGTENDVRMMLTTSRNGGANWAPPTAMVVVDHPKGFRITSPPVEDADGSWLVAAVTAGIDNSPRTSIFRCQDNGTTWQLLAKCSKATDAKQWCEPSLAIARDGRWVVLARETEASGKDGHIVVTVSRDQGATWSQPRPTGIDGLRPEIVELLDELFLVVVESDKGQLQMAFAWDELSHFLVRSLACGYCVRLNHRKYLARGSGPDLAGEFHDLTQVPIEAKEIETARHEATMRLPASDKAFRFRGNWNRAQDDKGDLVMTSHESNALVEIEFDGPTVFLVHDMAKDGRLVGVTIDGKEHPPVDMRGSSTSAVSTCLACKLPPGRHKLALSPLLAWRSGPMNIRAVEVAQAK